MSLQFASEIGAQQIAALTPPHLAQLGAIERKAERGTLGRHGDIDEAPGPSCRRPGTLGPRPLRWCAHS